MINMITCLKHNFSQNLLKTGPMFVKGSTLALGKINCLTGVPGTNENDSMLKVKSHSGLQTKNV